MHIEQFRTESLGDSSYLVVAGDTAAVIDPQRDVRPLLAAAERYGTTIAWVLETHVHNDYLSGGRELAELGARVVAPKKAGLEFPHMPVGEGETLAFGGLRLRAVAAPGHTYEHTAYLAEDEKGHVSGAFTGGSLLIAAAGRTDLLGPDHTLELTRLQWETAHRLDALLPDEAEILPTHGAGSFCSSGSSVDATRAPVREERRRNPLLTTADYDTFRDSHLASPPPIPGYYRYIAPQNRRGPEVRGNPPSPPLLEVERVAGLATSGEAEVIDLRSRHDYAAGHLPGAHLFEDGGALLAYIGWLLPYNAPVALVTTDAAQAERVTVDLWRIGFERVLGFVPAGDLGELASASMRGVSLTQAVEMVRDGGVRLFDVRFANESAAEPVPGAEAYPIERLPEWLNTITQGPVLTFCSTGYRASMAAGYLSEAGVTAMPLIEGGAGDLLPALGNRSGVEG